MVFVLIMVSVGFFIGIKIPKLSLQIINKKLQVNSSRSFHLDGEVVKTRSFKTVVALFNILLWALSAMLIEKGFVAVLVGLMLTLVMLFSIIDLFIRIIPNELVVVALLIGGLFQFTYFGINELLIAFISMVITVAVFVILGLIIGLEKVGVGDVKLAAVMAISLGYNNLLIAIFIMSVFLCVFSTIGILSKRLTIHSMIPLAPFMMSGMLIALITIMVNNVK